MSMNGKTLYDSGVIPKWGSLQETFKSDKLTKTFHLFLVLFIFIITILLLIILLICCHSFNMLELFLLAFVEIYIILLTGYTLIFYRMNLYRRIILTQKKLIVERYPRIGKNGKKTIIPIQSIIKIYTKVLGPVESIIIIYTKDDEKTLLHLWNNYIPNVEEFISSLKSVAKGKVSDIEDLTYKDIKDEVKRMNATEVLNP